MLLGFGGTECLGQRVDQSRHTQWGGLCDARFMENSGLHVHSQGVTAGDSRSDFAWFLYSKSLICDVLCASYSGFGCWLLCLAYTIHVYVRAEEALSFELFSSTLSIVYRITILYWNAQVVSRQSVSWLGFQPDILPVKWCYCCWRQTSMAPPKLRQARGSKY